MLFAKYTAEEVEDLIERAGPAASDPHALAPALHITHENAVELIGIIEARKKNKKFPDVRYLLPDDLRFGTHAEVAKWRAQRLACGTLIEVGAGVGMQTIAFAHTCKHVIAIEVDHRKVSYARENLKAAGITNVTLIEGDAMKVIDKLPAAADAVFLDPARPAAEAARDINANFSPPIKPFIALYGKIAPSITIELPPHMKTLELNGEREYISVDDELRRLTLYVGPLAKAQTSAVVLPESASINGTPAPVPASGVLKKYLLEVNEAVTAAGLAHMFVNATTHVYTTDRGVLLTSDINEPNPFFRNVFEVLAETRSDTRAVRESLVKANAKKVILRATLDPKQYWEVRSKYERGLSGTETVTLFLIGGTAIIAKKIDLNE